MKKIVVGLILISFMLMLIPFNVSASETYYDTFDDDTPGEFPDGGDPAFYTWETTNGLSAGLQIDDSQESSSPYCVLWTLLGGYDAYLNFTVGKQIEKISFRSCFASALDDLTYLMRFQDSSGTDIYKLKFDFDGVDYYFRNGNTDAEIGVINTPLYPNYWYLNISFNSTTDLYIEVSQVSDNTVHLMGEETTISGRSLATVDKIFFELVDEDGGEFQNFDNLEVTFSDSAVGDSEPDLPEGSAICDVTDYSSIGNPLVDYDHDIQIEETVIEVRADKFVDGTAFAFDFMVGASQRTWDDDLSNYHLYVNGTYAGQPESWVGTSVGYLMRFCFELDLDNVIPVMELYHNVTSPLGKTWEIVRLELPENPDSQDYYVVHSDTSFIDGEMSLNPFGGIQRPLVWTLYYTGEYEPVSDCDTDNSITLNNFLSEHPTEDLPYIYKYQTGLFTVEVNQTLTPHKIYIYREGVLVGFSQGYPVSVYDCSKVYGFVPLNDGEYNISLQNDNGDVIINKTFYVEDIDVDFVIFTNPNPSEEQESYDVTVFINETTSDELYVAMFDSVSDASQYDQAWFSSVLYNTTAGFYTFVFSNDFQGMESHYWRLFKELDGLYIPLSGIHIHYVDLVSTQQSYISLSKSLIELGESVTVSGKHSYFESDIRVFYDGDSFKQVGSIPEFSFTISPYDEIGSHVFDLRVKIDGIWVVLDSETLNVVVDADGSDVDYAFGMTEDEFFFLVGFVFLAIFLIIGAWIVSKIDSKEIQKITFATFGLSGVITNAYFGLWNIWVAFLLGLFMIAIIVLTIYKRS